jgi:N-acetylmuramoyl-L-alanine amidase
MTALKAWVVALLLLFVSTPSKPSIEVDLDCLAKTIYHEARGETHLGQIGVAWVVLNRVNSGLFPTTVCRVISQPGQFPWRNKQHRQSDLTAYQKAVTLAKDILDGIHPDPTNGSVYFQNIRRSGHGVFSVKIGKHYFFTHKRKNE